MKKLLSIITVVKNDFHNIEKTIKSIISQKNKFIEYIIIYYDISGFVKDLKEI